MRLFRNYIFFSLLFLNLFSGLIAQHINISLLPKKDTTNIYKEMLNDRSDDLMENHPADDIYNNIWTANRLNPYKIPIDSLPDSVKIDCRFFTVPVPGYVTSDFGPRRYRYHYGTDLKVNIGDTVVAAFSGRIRIIDYEARGYGHYVVIRHENGLESVYAHLSKVHVKLDQNVKSGEIIALAGNTGRSTGPHLHFETRYLGNAINPASIINFNTGIVHSDIYLITKHKSFYYQRAVAVAKKAQTSVKYYTVRKGDNLGSIAARNGTSIKNICRLNGIKQNKLLQLNQRLRVR
jgi:murein DD-endopeptidase MepM/ murein hydrolase activator NlpD